MDQKELAEIRARNEERKRLKEAASVGPWTWEHEQLLAPPIERNIDKQFDLTFDGEHRIVIETDAGVYPPREHDRAFIAHARNDEVEADVDALLAEIERLNQRIPNLNEIHRLLNEKVERMRAALQLGPELREAAHGHGAYEYGEGGDAGDEARADEILEQMIEAAK